MPTGEQTKPKEDLVTGNAPPHEQVEKIRGLENQMAGQVRPGFSSQDLQKLFTYQAPTGTSTQAFVNLRAKALEFAEAIQQLVPVCGEQTLAIRKVQEAIMWANAAIAHEGKY